MWGADWNTYNDRSRREATIQLLRPPTFGVVQIHQFSLGQVDAEKVT